MASHGLGGRLRGLALLPAAPSAFRPRGSMVLFLVSSILSLHPQIILFLLMPSIVVFTSYEYISYVILSKLSLVDLVHEMGPHDGVV
jgi:hypothetical protein